MSKLRTVASQAHFLVASEELLNSPERVCAHGKPSYVGVAVNESRQRASLAALGHAPCSVCVPTDKSLHAADCLSALRDDVEALSGALRALRPLVSRVGTSLLSVVQGIEGAALDEPQLGKQKEQLEAVQGFFTSATEHVWNEMQAQLDVLDLRELEQQRRDVRRKLDQAKAARAEADRCKAKLQRRSSKSRERLSRGRAVDSRAMARLEQYKTAMEQARQQLQAKEAVLRESNAQLVERERACKQAAMSFLLHGVPHFLHKFAEGCQLLAGGVAQADHTINTRGLPGDAFKSPSLAGGRPTFMSPEPVRCTDDMQTPHKPQNLFVEVFDSPPEPHDKENGGNGGGNKLREYPPITPIAMKSRLPLAVPEEPEHCRDASLSKSIGSMVVGSMLVGGDASDNEPDFGGGPDVDTREFDTEVMASGDTATSALFKKERTLGEGAYGKTFVAIDYRSDRPVVVKRVDFETQVQMNRTCREATLLGHFHNVDEVVSVEEMFVHMNSAHKQAISGHMNIVMEYCAGGDLLTFLREATLQKRFLSRKRAAHWLGQLARGMVAIHSHQLIHRDIKPANIFITDAQDLRIGDFGVAFAFFRPGELATERMGTPRYMAPEVEAGRPYGQSADIFSLGVVVYELLTLRAAPVNDVAEPPTPESGASSAASSASPEACAAWTRIVEELCSHIDERKYGKKMVKLVGRMLSYEPEKRPTAQEVLQTL